jgi:hypothetical protein
MRAIGDEDLCAVPEDEEADALGDLANIPVFAKIHKTSGTWRDQRLSGSLEKC